MFEHHLFRYDRPRASSPLQQKNQKNPNHRKEVWRRKCVSDESLTDGSLCVYSTWGGGVIREVMELLGRVSIEGVKLVAGHCSQNCPLQQRVYLSMGQVVSWQQASNVSQCHEACMHAKKSKPWASSESWTSSAVPPSLAGGSCRRTGPFPWKSSTHKKVSEQHTLHNRVTLQGMRNTSEPQRSVDQLGDQYGVEWGLPGGSASLSHELSNSPLLRTYCTSTWQSAETPLHRPSVRTLQSAGCEYWGTKLLNISQTSHTFIN